MIPVDYRGDLGDHECRFCHDVGCDICGAPEPEDHRGEVGECVACGVVEELPDGSRCSSCIKWDEQPLSRWNQEHPEAL